MPSARFEEPGFEDWLQPEVEDTNWVAHQVSLGLPLTLPWKNQKIRLGTCFQSRRQDTNPWLEDNPFILSDLYMIPKILKHDYGSTSTFRSVNTTRRTETSEHLSLGFGVGVGLPFLCSASVKGSYDEDVKKVNDGNKSSIAASVRSATVQLERNPRLCHEAMAMLKYGGGYEAFTQKYGDYVVWGFRLGGDTGLMLSSSSFSALKVDSYQIKATVEVLLIEASKTWNKDLRSFSAGKSMKLIGYDTLSNQHWNVATDEVGLAKLSTEAEEVILRSENILERTLMLLEQQGMGHGHALTHEQCEFLSSQGVVVELVLLPMAAIRDVSRWTTERGVI